MIIDEYIHKKLYGEKIGGIELSIMPLCAFIKQKLIVSVYLQKNRYLLLFALQRSFFGTSRILFNFEDLVSMIHWLDIAVNGRSIAEKENDCLSKPLVSGKVKLTEAGYTLQQYDNEIDIPIKLLINLTEKVRRMEKKKGKGSEKGQQLSFK